MVDRIEGRVAIDRRPAYIHKRRQAGHWEGDLMLFAKYGQAVWSLMKGVSLAVVCRQPNKAAKPVATKLTELFRSLPKSLRRTITFDNGTEFSYHHRLHKLSMRTFSATPMRHGKKAALKTASEGCAAACPGKPIWRHSLTNACCRLFVLIITLLESVSTTKLRQRFLSVTCCT